MVVAEVDFNEFRDDCEGRGRHEEGQEEGQEEEEEAGAGGGGGGGPAKCSLVQRSKLLSKYQHTRTNLLP